MNIWLGPQEREYVRGLLDSGALFPDEQFPLVRKILTAFLRHHPAAAGVVLNGLPRTIAQAERIEAVLKVRQVVFLDCPPDVAAAHAHWRRGGGLLAATLPGLPEPACVTVDKLAGVVELLGNHL